MGVYLDKRSGRYGIDLRVPPTRTGRRVRFLVGTKAEAQVVLAQKTVEARRQRFPILRPPPAPVSFDDAADRFLREHASERRSFRSFVSGVRLLKIHFSGQALAQIDGAAIRDFMQRRRAEGASNGTINRGRALLSSIFSFALDNGLLAGPHPLLRGTPGRVKPLREAPPRERYLSAEEAFRLILTCTSPLRELVLLAIHTGLRKGELLTLRWTDVRDGCIHLRAEVCKSGRSRIVPLTNAAEDALESLERNGGFVFHHRVGSPLRDLRRAWTRACKRAGLSGLRIHDLRHVALSFAADRGIDAFRLMKVAGHAALSTTQRYLASSP